MSKVREIIRYGCTTELSERQIARALQVSRAIVGKTLRAFRHSGLDCATAAVMADSELEKRLEGERTPDADSRYAVLVARFPPMVLELKKKGVTLQYLWERYCCLPGFVAKLRRASLQVVCRDPVRWSAMN